ncbi:hypothetical protein TRFO_10218 [Tritrichomonas foetus]|uniref:UBA domain-containing protein n=1 Tax=Tritrichomonas foetus TaxID=1144522 RepID=A0A1J4JF08_9EUKA|nr:hypothetical protein TRFO_10218 [Tritrichomonas foetus]|eukprot:OHS96037.1 hypothetical protein TRFO_10218 [Tritrichomonas foetus]
MKEKLSQYAIHANRILLFIDDIEMKDDSLLTQYSINRKNTIRIVPKFRHFKKYNDQIRKADPYFSFPIRTKLPHRYKRVSAEKENQLTQKFLNMMIDIGLNPVKSRKALKITNNNLDKSIELVLNDNKCLYGHKQMLTHLKRKAKQNKANSDPYFKNYIGTTQIHNNIRVQNIISKYKASQNKNFFHNFDEIIENNYKKQRNSVQTIYQRQYNIQSKEAIDDISVLQIMAICGYTENQAISCLKGYNK